MERWWAFEELERNKSSLRSELTNSRNFKKFNTYEVGKCIEKIEDLERKIKSNSLLELECSYCHNYYPLERLRDIQFDVEYYQFGPRYDRCGDWRTVEKIKCDDCKWKWQYEIWQLEFEQRQRELGRPVRQPEPQCAYCHEALPKKVFDSNGRRILNLKGEGTYFCSEDHYQSYYYYNNDDDQD